MKLLEVADTLKLSEGSVYTISQEHLGMRKLETKLPHTQSVINRIFCMGMKQKTNCNLHCSQKCTYSTCYECFGVYMSIFSDFLRIWSKKNRYELRSMIE